jgi:tRNA(Arg) A34 adenosine deaminase TadA
MDDRDFALLRHTFALAHRSSERGDQPYGAALAGPGGELLLEAGQTRVTSGDCTGHAETNLIREASQRWPRDFLANCTLYSSTEPCLMCTGAFAWSGIGRLVFGISQECSYREFPDAAPPRFREPVSCHVLLANVQPPVVVEGPLLEEEALRAHILWWETSARPPQ